MKWTSSAVLVAVLLIALTNCATQAVEVSDLTVDEAKATAQAGEMEVASRVPSEFVSDMLQREQGSLLSCEGDRNYSWAGHLTVYL